MIHSIAMRAQDEKLVTDFVLRMGERYAHGPNSDHGPGKHKAVSVLSPYIRRRLVLESDLVAAAINEHGAEAAGKLIREVVWRGYFKGWLERRRRSTPSLGGREDLRIARQMQKTGKGLGNIHRKFNSMDARCPHPHPDQEVGKALLYLTDCSIVL